MKLDLSKVEFSKYDLKYKVKVPSILDSKLAYFMGIHIGDGSMGFYRKYDYKLDYSGHLVDEYKFYTIYFKKLFSRLFNKELRVYHKHGEKGEWIQLSTQSKGISTFLNSSLGLPFGPKNSMHLPQLIMDSKFKKPFICGLADSDFYLTFKEKSKNFHSYPVIGLSSCNNNIIVEVNSILNKFRFRSNVILDFPKKRYNKVYISNQLEISGVDQLKLWMKTIGFNSRKHLTKYLVWKKFGFCPPYTTLPQREAILKRELDPYSFYKKT